ncbi:MAG TPA: 5,6-dimethylbenzimidazole synthase [Puia sp.]|nr:5,6-dimethylbenzimidazole synthase [Puia sp.]
MLNAKLFTDVEAAILQEIIQLRRDVRGQRFTDKPLSKEVIDQLLTAALHAPSVGFSQPWEFVLIKDLTLRQRVKESFDRANEAALEVFSQRQREYAQLKLEGILEAPLNMAVFYKPPEKPVLGQTTMVETGLYSVVCAVQNLWLMARALNVGVGWVSILDPEKVGRILNAPEGRRLVAYLCVGYTDGFYSQPELEILEWEKKKEREASVIYEQYKNLEV